MAVTNLKSPAALLPLLERYWGYDSFLPGQEDAIRAVLEGRDSLVVMPTGGGKSAIYQLPALAGSGLAVVVSPLISLMADQVYGLTTIGIPAATYNSSKSLDERRQIANDAREGRLKLLYVSPEALMAHPDSDSNVLLDLLAGTTVSFFAIDEAHCISQWGHDFWPSYRKLGTLRDRFGAVPIHAFTATATERVRADIVTSLRLRAPVVLVGDFDRPNLTYRVLARRDLMADLGEILKRHSGEAGVVYCATRDEVDTLGGTLASNGHKALGYHAGLSPEVRKERQEAFMKGEADIIVATVAFGMGIDRSDVRFIVHAAMPPSVENYSQESGRAGRDRLPAECVLLYAAQDLMAWKRRKGEPRTDADREAMARLHEVFRFASSLTCRHRFLVQYFGQAYEAQPCGACDVCLGECASLPESLAVAQSLLEGVRQVREAFGGAHVADVLHGASTARIKERRHDQLACYGSMPNHDTKTLRAWLDQLLAQDFLVQGDYAVLRFTGPGRDLLDGRGEVRLAAPPAKPRSTRGYSAAAAGDPTPAEEELFQALRGWRGERARERNWPAYMVFSDLTLRELSRVRPSNLEALGRIKGIGEMKRAEFGAGLLEFLGMQYESMGLPERVAVTDPDSAPGIGSAPGSVAGPVPGSAPGSMPGPVPGSAPGSVAGPVAGSAPGSVPGPVPGSAPGPVPGSAPGSAPVPMSSTAARGAKRSGDALSSTVQVSLDLYRSGLDADAIASSRGLTSDTIYGHLGILVEKGIMAPEDIVSPENRALVEEAVGLIGGEQPIGALRAIVPMSVAYGVLKLVLDDMKRRGLNLAPRDPSVLERIQFLIDLGQSPAPEAADHIASFFADPDAKVRALALHAYAAMAEVSLEPVVALLGRDAEADPLVRQSALRTLARRGGPELAPLVAGVAADPAEDPGTRVAANATLARWRAAADRAEG